MAKGKQTPDTEYGEPFDESKRPSVTVDVTFTDEEKLMLDQMARDRHKEYSRSMPNDDPFGEDHHRMLDELTVEGFRQKSTNE